MNFSSPRKKILPSVNRGGSQGRYPPMKLGDGAKPLAEMQKRSVPRVMDTERFRVGADATQEHLSIRKGARRKSRKTLLCSLHSPWCTRRKPVLGTSYCGISSGNSELDPSTSAGVSLRQRRHLQLTRLGQCDVCVDAGVTCKRDGYYMPIGCGFGLAVGSYLERGACGHWCGCW